MSKPDLIDDLIAMAKQASPDVPASHWQGLERALRNAHGGRKNDYLRRRPVEDTKASLIQRMEQAAKEQEATSGAQLAQRLGVPVRTVERYHPLIKGD